MGKNHASQYANFGSLQMFCEKTKVFFSKHFSLNFLADLMH